MKRQNGLWWIKFAGTWYPFATMHDALTSLHVVAL